MKRLVYSTTIIAFISFTAFALSETKWVKVTDKDAGISFNMPEGYQSSHNAKTTLSSKNNRYKNNVNAGVVVIVDFGEKNWNHDSLKEDIRLTAGMAKAFGAPILENRTYNTKFGDKEVPTLRYHHTNYKNEHYLEKIYGFEDFMVKMIFEENEDTPYNDSIIEEFFNSINAYGHKGDEIADAEPESDEENNLDDYNESESEGIDED